MKRPTLALLSLALLIGPVLLLRGQTQAGQPHGEIKLDCSQCHNPERWTPAQTARFRHESTGFVLESAHARASCRSCHRTLMFARVGVACIDCHKDVHRGRARDALRDLPHADHVDEPARDLPRPQQVAPRPDVGPRPARLHGVPPGPDAGPVREHAGRVRQLPLPDLPRDDEPEPRRRRASRAAARTATASRRRAGTRRPSRTPRTSRSPAGTRASPARAATPAAAARMRSRPPASRATSSSTRRRRTRTTRHGSSRPPARTATRSSAGGRRSSTTTRRASR